MNRPRTHRGAPLRTLTALIASAALLAGVVTTTSSCAVFNIDKTPVLRTVDEHLLPARDSSWRGVAVIGMLPVGLVAAIIDQVLVIPVAESDDAYRDTKTAIWGHFEFDEHYVTEMALMPLRVVVTPIVFVCDLLARTILDLPAHPREGESAEGTSRAIRIELDGGDEFWAEHPDAESAAEEDPLGALRGAIAAGDAERAMALLDATWEFSDTELLSDYESLLVAAATQLDLPAERRAVLIGREQWRFVDGADAAARLERIKPLLTHGDAVVRREGVKLLWRGFPQGDAWVATLSRDADPYVRLQWLQSAATSRSAMTPRQQLAPAFFAEVQRMAASDSEPVVRLEAQNVLRINARN